MRLVKDTACSKLEEILNVSLISPIALIDIVYRQSSLAVKVPFFTSPQNKLYRNTLSKNYYLPD